MNASVLPTNPRTPTLKADWAADWISEFRRPEDFILA